ncbi:TetR/AcrR family transcriptional regulator [Vagococcus carniphilus]|uniref:TetR/AcrR family transcriptional regulator n=1 Tax=Vagococcus carniphilus TaxID=218144 RepID=UPI003B5CCE81
MARNKYPERTRKAILESAAKLFTFRGWENVTIQEVIDDVGGITRGAFYHHFKSKADLIDAVTEEYFSENKSVLNQITDTKTKAVDRLRQGIILSLKKQTEKGAMTNIPSVVNSPEFIFRIVHDSIEVTATEVSHLIEEGNKDGSCQVENIKEVSEMMMLLFNIWSNPNIIHVSQTDYQSKIRFIDQLLKTSGLPLIDESVIDAFMAYYEETKK